MIRSINVLPSVAIRNSATTPCCGLCRILSLILTLHVVVTCCRYLTDYSTQLPHPCCCALPRHLRQFSGLVPIFLGSCRHISFCRFSLTSFLFYLCSDYIDCIFFHHFWNCFILVASSCSHSVSSSQIAGQTQFS